MNYDFLRGYNIPLNNSGTDGYNASPNNWSEMRKIDDVAGHNTYNAGCAMQKPPPPPSGLSAFFDTYDDGQQQPQQDYGNYHQYQNPNRYIPPGKQGTNYQASPSRPRPPMKRKYPTVEKSKPPIIAEETPDGKLNIFVGRDDSYPDELNKAIHPLSCDLCAIQMNSAQSAKDHYESKAHDRRITDWLTKNYTAKGLNPPQVKRFMKSGPTGPEAFRCELCDLLLTSLTHASQHYSGRKHRLVASKVSKPSGAGFYNFEGKWVRTATKVNPAASTDGRFGIGDQFQYEATLAALAPKTTLTAADTTTVSSTDESPAVVPVAVAPKKPKLVTISAAAVDPIALQCDLCNISVTSTSQMTMHLEGTKHKKKLKTTEASPLTGTLKSEKDISILASVTAKSAPLNDEDLSMYRTPTGSYYCKICNISMCHLPGLQQHLLGRKHVRKMADQKTAAVDPKKTAVPTAAAVKK